MKNKWLLAIIALSLSVSANATLIAFNPNGGGADGAISGVNTFDWKSGNALVIGGNPAAGLKEGDNITLLFQTNLGSITDNDGRTVFSNSDNGNYFTLVAGFEETVSSVDTNG